MKKWFIIGIIGISLTLIIAITTLVYTIFGDVIEPPLFSLPMVAGGILFSLGVKNG